MASHPGTPAHSLLPRKSPKLPDPCLGQQGFASPPAAWAMTAPPAPAAGHRRGISCSSLPCHRRPRVLAGSPRVGWYTRGVARFGLSEPNARAFAIGRLRPGPPRCDRPAPRSLGHPSAALPPGRGGQRGLKAAGSRSPPQVPAHAPPPGRRPPPPARRSSSDRAPQPRGVPARPPRPGFPGRLDNVTSLPSAAAASGEPPRSGPVTWRGSARPARPAPLRPRPAYCYWTYRGPGPCARRRAEAEAGAAAAAAAEGRRRGAAAAGPGGGAAGSLCEGRRGALRSARLGSARLRSLVLTLVCAGRGPAASAAAGEEAGGVSGAALPPALRRAAGGREGGREGRLPPGTMREGGGGAESRRLRGPARAARSPPASAPGGPPERSGRGPGREAAGQRWRRGRGAGSHPVRCEGPSRGESIVGSRAGRAGVRTHGSQQQDASPREPCPLNLRCSLSVSPHAGCVLPCLQALAGGEAPMLKPRAAFCHRLLVAGRYLLPWGRFPSGERRLRSATVPGGFLRRWSPQQLSLFGYSIIHPRAYRHTAYAAGKDRSTPGKIYLLLYVLQVLLTHRR